MKTTVLVRLYPTPEKTCTKDFTAALPRAVKNQALRDARSVWKRSLRRRKGRREGGERATLPAPDAPTVGRRRKENGEP